MLFKSLWFVFIVTVLVVSIIAAPNNYKRTVYARNYVVEEKALPVLKRQEQPWRNETRTLVLSTTAHEALPVSLSSSTSVEHRQTTSASQSDKVSSVVGTPTRSLSSSPEGSSSESIGPITSKHNDLSSTPASSIDSLSTHASSSKQEPSSLASASRQTPQPAASSMISASTRVSSTDTVTISASQQVPISQYTSTPIASPSPNESSQKPSQTSVSQLSSSVVDSSQKTSTYVVPSSFGQQLPSSSTVFSEQAHSIISSWSFTSSMASPVSANVPSSVTMSSTSQPIESVLSSSLLSATPAPQPSISQMVSSSIVIGSSWTTPGPSNQIPVSLPTVTSTGGIGASLGLSSQISLAPSGQTPPASSSADSTISPGISQSGLSSFVPATTFTNSASTPIVTLPSLSSSAAAISNASGDVSSSVTASRQESSAYVSGTETWTPSASSIVSATSLVLPTASTVSSALDASITSSNSISVHSSIAASIPASETFNSPSPSPSVSMPLNVTLSGVTSPLIFSTTLTSVLSDTIQSSTISLTGSPSWVSPTMSTNSAALNSSTSLGLDATPSTTSLLSSRSSSSLSFIVTPSASPSAVSIRSTTSDSRLQVSATAAAIPTPSILINGTTVPASQATPETTQRHQGWNVSSTLNAGESTNTIRGAAFPTGFVISPTGTASQIPPTAALSNSTSLLVGYTSEGASTSSTLVTIGSYTGISRTVSATVSATGSATTTSIASPPPPPPLTTPQKAGVVIAGTTGLLLAVVAAIYLTRRHYTKKGRRSSTGSIYPKVAYLYDPPSGGRGGEGYPDETLMSGASSGMPLLGQNLRAPTNSPNLGHKRNTGSLPMRFSDPGNPFRDPEDPFRSSDDFDVITPTNTAAAFSAAIKGYTAAPQKSPHTTDFPTMEPLRDIDWPSSSSHVVMSDARMPDRSSILSEIASMAYNPNVYSNTSASRRERLSPYSFHQNHSLPCVRETTYTDSLRDPFEHDLLLQVDTRTETPDSVTVFAPPATSIAPGRETPPVNVFSRNPWASSMLDPSAAQLPSRPLSRLVEQSPISPDATVVGSERFSLMYDNDVAATYIATSPTQVHNAKSPPGPVHKGWDDIKRWSADKLVPSPVAFSPPLRHWSPPPNKKKSLPQLRRKEAQLFGSAEATRSTDRLPLRVKVPFTNHKNSSAEHTRLSQFAKLDARSQNNTNLKSPESTFHHSMHSLTSLIQKKKSGDMEFACAGV